MSDEPIRPFEVTTPPKSGVIRRLLGRVSREAAFVEIRNLLARTPFDEVRQGDIVDILGKAKVSCREASAELALIFEHAALILAADQELSDRDRGGLSAVQRAFELTDQEAGSAIQNAVGQVFERTMRESLADGRFTAEDKVRLEETSTSLGMSDSQTRRLYEAAAVAAVQSAVSVATADRRYSKDEEARVSELAAALDVTMLFSDKSTDIISRFKMLAEI